MTGLEWSKNIRRLKGIKKKKETLAKIEENSKGGEKKTVRFSEHTEIVCNNAGNVEERFR